MDTGTTSRTKLQVRNPGSRAQANQTRCALVTPSRSHPSTTTTLSLTEKEVVGLQRNAIICSVHGAILELASLPQGFDNPSTHTGILPVLLRAVFVP